VSTCVIFNPTARGDKARHFREQVQQLKTHWSFKPTTGPGAARHLAKEAVAEGFRTIIAAGGDGTLNEVVNGIGDAPDGFERIRFGILPLGTLNVFAREIRLPLGLAALLPWMETAGEILLDVGHARFQKDQAEHERYFLQLAGAGLDALSVECVNWELKKRIGRFAYVAAGLKALSAHQPIITASDGTTTVGGELVLIGNGKLYGGDYPLFHKSDLQDGLLDALVFKSVAWSSLPGHLWPILNKRTLNENRVGYLQGSQLTLRADSRVPFQLDGDSAGELPATVIAHHKKLRVLAPGNGRFNSARAD
jgi:YegS/Rv2252/BmrU family lipid kinase